jgi:CheY-like chemotaxis protein
MQLSGDSLARAENVMKSAARAAELTRQLLAFSRKQIVQPKVLCLNPIIEDIAKMSAHLVGENIEIAAALCDAPWLIHVDRSQMEQILMNLIVNARDAMPNGGKLTLETANANLTTEYLSTHPLMSPGRYVMLAVSDTGVGMDAETQARLFEPFFTTKELGKGTGLGLSVVYGIVKQSNGFIWHYSELGKGTCFRIYLPIAEVQESKEVVHPPLAVAAGAKNATVLLVEDEEALRDVISEFLTSAGNEVIAAASHEEALELLLERRSPIDLLLTDVVLKGRNGKQLAEALKDKGYALNVIYMSGYTPSAIVHHGVLEADTMFLQKPFTRTALLAKVQEALGR